MGKFSKDNQPSAEARLREVCRKGHPMAQGDPNARVRGDGKRVCRTCESSCRSRRYKEQKERTAPELPIPEKGWNADNLVYPVERYEVTPVETLKRFILWQRAHLNKAQEAKPHHTIPLPSGGTITSEFVVEMLQRDMVQLAQIILRKDEEKEKNNGKTEGN